MHRAQHTAQSLVVAVLVGGGVRLAEPDRQGSDRSSACKWASGLSFLICKTGIIIVSTSQGGCGGQIGSCGEFTANILLSVIVIIIITTVFASSGASTSSPSACFLTCGRRRVSDAAGPREAPSSRACVPKWVPGLHHLGFSAISFPFLFLDFSSMILGDLLSTTLAHEVPPGSGARAGASKIGVSLTRRL